MIKFIFYPLPNHVYQCLVVSCMSKTPLDELQLLHCVDDSVLLQCA